MASRAASPMGPLCSKGEHSSSTEIDTSVAVLLRAETAVDGSPGLWRTPGSRT
ncbi:hypothetical protein [Streptomyces sp. ADI95-16]|uniref:hypothetical protein n=1 Tax=Streptomyces sp. ADI95-16 TaxID=1522758 RepID=UPI0013DDA46C|nr:hypothetical protein [Streptomyces sp. ADI95-16]